MSYVQNFPGGFQTSTDKPLDYRSVVADIDALEPKVLQTLYVGLVIFDQATGKHYKIDSTDGTQGNLVYSEASGGSARYDIVRARDPLVTDDANVTGVVKNAIWFNETGGKLWICRDNAVGAAVWVEYLANDGIVYGQLEHIEFPMPEFTYSDDSTWDEKEVTGATVTVLKTAKYRLSGVVHAVINNLDDNSSVNITQADFFYFSITVNGVDQGIKVAAGTSTNNREANLSDILAVANFNHLIELSAGDILQLHVRIYNIGSWNATASITVNGDSATGLTHTSSFLDLKEEPSSVSVPVNKVSYGIQANRDPLPTDDADSADYDVNVNQIWYNNATGKTWICTNASTGAAVWKKHITEDELPGLSPVVELDITPSTEIYSDDARPTTLSDLGGIKTVPTSGRYHLNGIINCRVENLSKSTTGYTSTHSTSLRVYNKTKNKLICAVNGSVTHGDFSVDNGDGVFSYNLNAYADIDANDQISFELQYSSAFPWASNSVFAFSVTKDDMWGFGASSVKLTPVTGSFYAPLESFELGIKEIRDPTTTDDSDSAVHTIQVNQHWLNTNTGKSFICTDATPGAAVWTKQVTEDELPGLQAVQNHQSMSFPTVYSTAVPQVIQFTDEYDIEVQTAHLGENVPFSVQLNSNLAASLNTDNNTLNGLSVISGDEISIASNSGLVLSLTETIPDFGFDHTGKTVSSAALCPDGSYGFIIQEVGGNYIAYVYFSYSDRWFYYDTGTYATKIAASGGRLTYVHRGGSSGSYSYNLRYLQSTSSGNIASAGSGSGLNLNDGSYYYVGFDYPSGSGGLWATNTGQILSGNISSGNTFWALPSTDPWNNWQLAITVPRTSLFPALVFSGQKDSLYLYTNSSEPTKLTIPFTPYGDKCNAVWSVKDECHYILIAQDDAVSKLYRLTPGTSTLDHALDLPYFGAHFSSKAISEDTSGYLAFRDSNNILFVDPAGKTWNRITLPSEIDMIRDWKFKGSAIEVVSRDLKVYTFQPKVITGAVINFKTKSLYGHYVPTDQFDLGIKETRDPIETDDSDSSEYYITVNQFWHNEATGHTFVCRDATPGAAVWRKHVTEDELNGYEPAFSGSVFIPQTIAPSATLTSTGYTIPEDSNCTIKYGAFFKAVPSATANLEIKVDGNLVQSIPQSEASINDSFSLDLLKDQVLTAEYTLSEYSNWNDYGRATGLASMNDPRGLAAFNGRVYLADNTGTSAETDVIAVQEQDGTWTNISGESNQPDLTQIGDVAATSNGSYYASRTPAEVWYRTHAGTWINIGEATGHPTWVQPFGITADKDGNIYVVDRDLTDIWKYDGDSWSAIALDAAATDPRNIAVTDNYIYVVDQATDTFMRMDRSDNTWTTVAGTGIPTWQDIRRCHAIGTDIYVSDVSAVKIYRYVEPEDRWEDFSALTGQPSSGVIGRSLSDIDGVLIAADYVSDTIWSIQEQVIAGPVAVSIETTPKAYYRPITDISFGISETRDPTVLDDLSSETYNIQVNQVWLNETNGTIWLCRDASIGAAKWSRMVTQEELSGGQLLKSGDAIRSPGVYSASIGAEIAVDPVVDFFVVSNWTDIEGTPNETGGQITLDWGGPGTTVVTVERNNGLIFKRASGTCEIQDIVNRDEYSFADTDTTFTVPDARVKSAAIGATAGLELVNIGSEETPVNRLMMSTDGIYASWEGNAVLRVDPSVKSFMLSLNGAGIGTHEVEVPFGSDYCQVNIVAAESGMVFAYAIANGWSFISTDPKIGKLTVLNDATDGWPSEASWNWLGDVSVAKWGTDDDTDTTTSDTGDTVAIASGRLINSFTLSTASGVPTVTVSADVINTFSYISMVSSTGWFTSTTPTTVTSDGTVAFAATDGSARKSDILEFIVTNRDDQMEVYRAWISYNYSSGATGTTSSNYIMKVMRVV